MTDDNKSTSSDQRALIKFLLENRAMVNWISILMIVYAVWATIEVLTNASGATWWPPETGTPVSDYFESDTSSQNINNGWVIGLGAVFGTLGVMVQYFYRAAPYVDASMQATAALIISAVKEEEIQESAERLAVEMVAEAEEAEAAAEAEAKAEAEAEAAAKAEAEAEAAAKAEANTVEQADTSAAETVASDEDLVEDGQRKKF
jgi:nucleoid-associated protein YgaU